MMRFFILSVPLLLSAISLLALADNVTVTIDLVDVFGSDMSASNHYGAPFPPWVHGSYPGWYFGNFPWFHPGIPCFPGPSCKLLGYFPFSFHCPPNPPHPLHTPPPKNDRYHQTFNNLTGATQAADYMTYGLVDTVTDCKAMCDSVDGCQFVNSYHDVHGKEGSPQLTCSLFSNCHTNCDADNKGGQTQPDETVDFIINSEGYCKNGY